MFQSYDEMLHLILHAASDQFGGDRRVAFYGHIVSYDPKTHAVRVQIPGFQQDEDTPGILSPWLPLASPFVGDGFGAQFAPQPDASGGANAQPSGTPCQILLVERDGAAVVEGLRFADKHQPPFPTIKPGEAGIKSIGGGWLFLDANGNSEYHAVGSGAALTLKHDTSGAEIVLNADGSIQINSQNAAVQINGTTDWAVMAQKLIAAFNSHVHSNSGGSGDGGPPAAPLALGDVASQTVNIGA